MADPHLSNPAGRLLLFIQSTAGGQVPCRTQWARYLGTDPEDWPQFLPAMSEVIQLPGEIERVAREAPSLPVPIELLIRPARKARDLLGGDPTGNGAASSFMDRVKDLSLISDLEYASAILAGLPTATAAIETDTIQRIRDIANELAQMVTDDESLESDVREALLRFAHRLTRAADLYKVAGPQALIDEIDRFYAEATRKDVPRHASAAWQKAQEVAGIVLMAVGLFTAGADGGNALATYAGVIRQITTGQ